MLHNRRRRGAKIGRHAGSGPGAEPRMRKRKEGSEARTAPYSQATATLDPWDAAATHRLQEAAADATSTDTAAMAAASSSAAARREDDDEVSEPEVTRLEHFEWTRAPSGASATAGAMRDADSGEGVRIRARDEGAPQVCARNAAG